jgi:putative copper resistance protein D
VDVFAVAVRTTQLASLVTLAGAFAFLVLVARPAALAAGAAGRAALPLLDRRILVLARLALGVALAAGLLDLWRQIAVATGAGLWEALEPREGLAVLLDTRYGLVWLARHALLVLLGVLVLLARGHEDPTDWLALRGQGLGFSAASLALGAAAGHAASAEAGAPAVALDALHLVAAAVWGGALVPLALGLAWARRLPPPAATQVAATAAARFSAVGLAAVGTLAASGIALAWQQVGGIPGLLGTPYGRWLGAKLALFGALVVVAAGNHLVWRRRLAAGGAAAAGAAVRLRRRVLGEAALVGAILAIVAVLGLTTPARHADVVWPLAFRPDWGATRDLPGVRPRVAIGSQLATFGLVALLLALVVRPRRWHAAALGGALAMVLGGVIALPPLAVDAHPTTYLRPAVPYTATSIVQGAGLYRAHCQGCHGPSGYGDGPAGVGLPRRPADLTARHAADHTAGDLFWWIGHGIPGSGMPGFADRLSTEERWDVINFVRALSSAERARELGSTTVSRPAIVAPDFAYTVGVGEGRALRDARGRGVVLLVFFTLPTSADRLVQLNEAALAFRLAGGEILGIPLRDQTDVYRALGARAVHFPIAVDGAADAALAYALFRPEGVTDAGPAGPSALAHMELLVDRQGYLRARWAPRDGGPGGGWTDVRRLLGEVERLAREVPAAPAAAEHVH